MKYNLLRYLREYRGKTFREAPFSEVDALLLSQLSYLKFDGVVPGFGRQPSLGWEEIRQHPRFEHFFEDEIYGETYRKIFRLICDSRRYGKIRLNYFVSDFDAEKELQFAAVTLFLGERSIFVSYRGTDESLVGWKEDFNMSFMESIPAQRRAAAYLLKTARYTEGRIALGGHSKGGNLAAFAAAYATGQVQRRICRIYSFDGPGFRKEFYARPGFLAIADRFCKIVPEESMIGMLFANHAGYRVVRSYGRGVIQHDLLRWKIWNGQFVYRKRVYRRNSRRMRMLNAWIDSLPKEQVIETVDVLYHIFSTARISTVYELLKRPLYQFGKLAGILRGLDEHSRNLVRDLFRKILF